MTATQAPTKRELEAALRGAGLSARQAKKVLAKGYSSIANENDGADVAEQLEQLAQRLRGT